MPNGERHCGECTACCKTHPIVEIGKPARIWCSHCRIGAGCGIYGNHPEGCREFECQWLMGHGSDAERPDRVKIVVDHVQLPGIGFVMMVHELTEGALAQEFATRVTGSYLRQNISVCHLPLRGNNKIYLTAFLSRAFLEERDGSMTINERLCEFVFWSDPR